MLPKEHNSQRRLTTRISPTAKLLAGAVPDAYGILDDKCKVPKLLGNLLTEKSCSLQQRRWRFHHAKDWFKGRTSRARRMTYRTPAPKGGPSDSDCIAANSVQMLRRKGRDVRRHRADCRPILLGCVRASPGRQYVASTMLS